MHKKILSILLGLAIILPIFAEGLKFNSYKLKNGMSVYLCEDKNQVDIKGAVTLKVGSTDEPDKFTGLAHYLEHMLFKGTEKIGSFDWEKEKPLYEKIIKLYDQFSDSKDPVFRAKIEKEINELSIESAKYARTNEFSNLISALGGEGLNAATSQEMTYYYNSFPSYQLEKWLDLYAERFVNPVFRAFQAELENVFEEYNLYEDEMNTHIRNFIFSNLFAGTPYGRNIIGLADHLKNPRLSVLIDFYNKWYVPENMALILVGKFDSETAIPLIEAKFSKLKAKKSPPRVSYTETPFDKDEKISTKIGYSPQVIWAYKTVERGHKDEVALEFCAEILSNSMHTGLLDKLSLDGDLQSANASLISFRNTGRFIITATPYYDINQRMYESDNATEKIIMAEIDKLITGNIPDWLINSVKKNVALQNKLRLENPEAKLELLKNLFTYDLPTDYYSKSLEALNSITKEDIKKTAEKYLLAGKKRISIEAGKPKKNKLNKPDIKPIDQPKTGFSEYAKHIEAIPIIETKEVFNDFNSVEVIKLYDGITLHYTKNELNDVFSLSMEYGVGTKKMPKLQYSTTLMRSAGIEPNIDAQSVMKQFSELNSRVSYSVSQDYFHIGLTGEDKNLSEICKLMTRQILFPKLDDKQLNKVKGMSYWQRNIEKRDIQTQSDALLNFLIFQDKSSYIDRIKLSDIFNMKISELTGEVLRATNFELNLHYVGTLAKEELIDILKSSLPLKEGVQKSESPTITEIAKYEKSNIFFLPNAETQQSKIYFYIHGPKYKIEDEYKYQAFVRYLSGGFNGILLEQIREDNSMAYTVYGTMQRPPLQNKDTYFLGYIGTQPDKTADAIDLYVNILKELPQHPERLENIKSYLLQSNLMTKPLLRERSRAFAFWRKLGYTDDPARSIVEKINGLKFEDILDFYNQYIKNKPLSMVVIGDKKRIDTKQIEKNNTKIQYINSSKIFKTDKL